MSNRCVHCDEAWDFDDFVCPCCDQAAVEQDSLMPATLKYKIDRKKNEYDVIRIDTGKSVFDEAGNYMNKN